METILAAAAPIKGGINTYNEKPLHAALKTWYAVPGDLQEVRLEGFFIDLIHDDTLIEVQTRSFGAIRRKLTHLCAAHSVRLVYPIPAEKWIILLDSTAQNTLSRRKSPRRDTIEELFNELVFLPELMQHEHFTFDVLLIQEEEVRRSSARHGRYGKGWVKHERRLLGVLEQHTFTTPADLSVLLPVDLPQPFTTRQLANALHRPIRLAQKMAYCLKAMDVLQLVGKQGKSNLYSR